jgi:hypothetical protein
MTADQPIPDRSHLSRAVEISIHIGLVALLVAACFLVLSPFIAMVAWGLTIAIAGYPAYRWLQKLLGGRGGLAAVVFTVLLLAVLVVPIVMLSQTLVDGSQAVAARLHNGTVTIPPPPANIATWPILGQPLSDLWGLACLPRLAASLRNSRGLPPNYSRRLPPSALAWCSFSSRLWLRDCCSPTPARVRELRESSQFIFSATGPRSLKHSPGPPFAA